MKKISSFLILCISLLTFTSCETEDDVVFQVGDASEVVFTNAFLAVYKLSQQTPDNIGERFTWNSVDFGVQTNVTYDLEAAVVSDFSVYSLIGSTSGNELAITIGQLWSLGELAGLDNDPNTPEPSIGDVYFRLKASVGTADGEERYSAVQALTLELLEEGTVIEESLPLLAVPGNHQGWNPGDAPLVAASAVGQSDYEGFIWLDGGYKFVAPDNDGNFQWGNTDWGDDGTFTGKLAEQDEVDCMADAATYYLVRANTGLLTYNITETLWGVIGDATSGGWDNDTDMVYDNGTKLWTVTLALSVGEIKFRANDDWAINFGDNDADGSLEFDGANVAISEAGTYLVTLDLSNPREYTYSLELQ